MVYWRWLEPARSCTCIVVDTSCDASVAVFALLPACVVEQVAMLCTDKPSAWRALAKIFSGVMQMLDQGERDDKLIAVHADDPEYKGFSDISQLPPHRLAEIRR
jgi:hypothetical protein